MPFRVMLIELCWEQPSIPSSRSLPLNRCIPRHYTRNRFGRHIFYVSFCLDWVNHGGGVCFSLCSFPLCVSSILKAHWMCRYLSNEWSLQYRTDVSVAVVLSMEVWDLRLVASSLRPSLSNFLTSRRSRFLCLSSERSARILSLSTSGSACNLSRPCQCVVCSSFKYIDMNLLRSSSSLYKSGPYSSMSSMSSSSSMPTSSSSE